MQKITPFLWFDNNAEEAMNYYVSVFQGSPRKTEARIVAIKRYPEGPLEGPMKGFDGKVLTGIFELAGQTFMALDGGPIFKFNESVSMLVSVADQEELDYYWSKLSSDPNSEQCGWCKDKFGLSWQVVPENWSKLMDDPDPKKAKRMMDAMLKMKKLDIAELERVRNEE